MNANSKKTTVAISFTLREGVDADAELQGRVSDYAQTIDNCIEWGAMASEAAKKSDTFRKPLKLFMVENGVEAITAPSGAVAALKASKSSQPNRKLAREILDADTYRRIFEEPEATVVLSFQKVPK